MGFKDPDLVVLNSQNKQTKQVCGQGLRREDD